MIYDLRFEKKESLLYYSIVKLLRKNNVSNNSTIQQFNNCDGFSLNNVYYTREREHNGGYALMLSIVVSSIVLSIGLSLFNIVQKELILSATGRDSQFAFYSADGGVECALYWDIKKLALPANLAESNGNNEPPPPSTPGIPDCGLTDFSGGVGFWNSSINDGSTAYVPAGVDGGGNPIPASGYEDDIAGYVLAITFQDASDDSPGSCALIVIEKKDNPNDGGYQIMTTIESKGYNDECALDNPALVERAISVTY